MNDEDKIAVLKASMLNIGRLLPSGMRVTFSRLQGEVSKMEMIYPDGEVTQAVFTSISPIYRVPVVPAEYSLDSYKHH